MNNFIQNPYLTMAFLGLVACSIVAYINFSRMKLPQGRFYSLLSISLVSFFVGACGSTIANWFLFDITGMPLKDRLYIAGGTWYPGILAFLLVFAVSAKLLHVDVKRAVDGIVPSILIFLAIARLGCVFAGCCYGVEAHFEVFGHTFSRVPTALIESLFSFLFFFVMEFFIKRHRLPVYMYVYGVFRFILEFYRGDNRGELIPGISLSTSQQIALSCIIVTTIVLSISFLKRKKSPKLEDKIDISEKNMTIADNNF